MKNKNLYGGGTYENIINTIFSVMGMFTNSINGLFTKMLGSSLSDVSSIVANDAKEEAKKASNKLESEASQSGGKKKHAKKRKNTKKRTHMNKRKNTKKRKLK